MCGLTGFWTTTTLQPPPLQVVEAMTTALQHRGPDSEGFWVDAEAGVAFGHRRLSILDLSEEGAQPMHSASGRYVVIFNGEIYNYRDVQRELGSEVVWRGHSDTEVLLAAVERWGVESAVRRFNGMFAFALWDRREAILHLVRDRMGIKPMYYGTQGSTLVFGSELKAFFKYPGFPFKVNSDAVSALLRYGYVPAQMSILHDVHKVTPGTILSFSAPDRPSSMAYWSFREISRAGRRDRFEGKAHEAVEALDDLLKDAVRLRMIADVPLGAFLSGGIDSSTVVALMQAQSRRPVQTFSIGFEAQAHDEAPYAESVARHLQTAHETLYVTPREVRDVIPRLPTLYDEPFADQSQIPTFLVSQLARQHVTVSLSGDGGDELFGGYSRYDRGSRRWNRIQRLPRPLRRTLNWSKPLFGEKPTWVYRLFNPLVPGMLDARQLEEKARRAADMMAASSPAEFYQHLMSEDGHHLVSRNGANAHSVWTDSDGDVLHQMMQLDTLTYLPDDILVKVDRASMGVGLEARVPLLDHRVVELAWRLPLDVKRRNGQGKWVLREVLGQYVPAELFNRPKHGFSIPIGGWLRAELRDWAEDLLDEQRLRETGLFDVAAVQRTWHHHLAGFGNLESRVWRLLMFQAWMRHYG